MLQAPLDWTESPYKDMKSHLDEIVAGGGERGEKLQVLSTGIHHYSKTKHSVETVRNCFAIVSGPVPRSVSKRALMPS